MAVLAAAVALMAGCGDGGGSPGPAGAEDPSEEGAVEFARALASSVYSGDWSTLRAGFSERCQAEVSLAELGVQMEFALSFAAGFSGFERDDFERMEVGEVVVSEFVAGERAVIGVEFVLDGQTFSAADEEPSEYLFVDGRWQTDECEIGFGDE
jgi:hypothetical protein